MKKRKNWLVDLKTLLKEFLKREAMEKEKELQKKEPFQPVNLYKLRGMSDESVPEQPQFEEINCDRCRDQKATLCCTDCNLPFCHSCFHDVHSKGKYKMHVVQPYTGQSFATVQDSYQPEVDVTPYGRTMEKQQSNSQIGRGRPPPPLRKSGSKESIPLFPKPPTFRQAGLAPTVGSPATASINSPANVRKPAPGRGFTYI